MNIVLYIMLGWVVLAALTALRLAAGMRRSERDADDASQELFGRLQLRRLGRRHGDRPWADRRGGLGAITEERRRG